MEKALLSLEGLSVGDAFGQQFFGIEDKVLACIEKREIPEAPWYLTDDSIMAIGIVDIREKRKRIRLDDLAKTFAKNYLLDPRRGYGGMAHSILQDIGRGKRWFDVAPTVFDGSGSFGNGAAMRVAPLGAYFAKDTAKVISEAHTTEVTHAHPEGIAGGMAVALAAAWTTNHAGVKDENAGKTMLEFVLEHTPNGSTRDGIYKALNLPFSYNVQSAVSVLGNGHNISSQDTVPFALWCAARHIDDYEQALWATVSGLGDRDTTCAMVGGIVVMNTGIDFIPKLWLDSRESLTDWEADSVKRGNNGM